MHRPTTLGQRFLSLTLKDNLDRKPFIGKQIQKRTNLYINCLRLSFQFLGYVVNIVKFLFKSLRDERHFHHTSCEPVNYVNLVIMIKDT